MVSHEIYPDEILLDARNSPKFNAQQMEGKIEKPISKRAILLITLFAGIFGSIAVWKLWSLQVVNGAYYADRSTSIGFDKIPVFADRGVVYDRNGKELIWNVESPNDDTFSHRAYIAASGFGHLLGYVSYPSKDTGGTFWKTEFVGKDGIEKMYNDRLQGVNGTELVEIDVHQQIQSRHLSTAPVPGENLHTTIDARLQEEMHTALVHLIKAGGYNGGAGVLLDATTGEVLVLTNAPEYDPKVLSDGDNRDAIVSYNTDPRRVYLNRAVSGLYTPGSIVKPFVALGALNEGIITPLKQILSTGSISIPNPYNPKLETVFKDWKAHGWVDMREALAVSSDVYFYEVGGGFHDQKGIGIAGIDTYNKLFGVGEKTGIDLPNEAEGTIPTPEWKEKNFKGDKWRIGDTYHTAIGQYGFQATPLQMARAIGGIATNGTLYQPHLLLDATATTPKETVSIPLDYFKVVKEGMRQGVTLGTTVAVNVPFVQIAAKSGTAQVGASKNRINSWVVGFFPYENPKYAFAILAESAPNNSPPGAVTALREFIDWMNIYTPEYFGGQSSLTLKK